MTIGINLSGAEFGGTGTKYGYDYAYPSAADLAYYASHGVTLVRLPFKWERMQPQLGGELSQSELGHLKQFLADAAMQGIKVIIDLHNFGTYGGSTIGSDAVTYAQFADFWGKLAAEVKGSPALLGYDIMNEPHDMGGPQVWQAAAQAAVDSIRAVDSSTAIYVEGYQWASAMNWLQYNADLDIRDPANKIVYEAHQYFDKWSSGTYPNSYAADGAYPDIGVDRLKPFADWLAAHGAQGFIGEFGVPSNDPQWLEVMDRFVSAMDELGISGTAWGGGSMWSSSYNLRLGSARFGDTSALKILQNYMTQSDGPALNGSVADETLNGTVLADRIFGGAGNDVLHGGGGNDLLSGGDGVDSADYRDSITSVDVDLSRGVQLRGDAQGDVLTGIENVLGSSRGDTLRGNAGANRLAGNDGDDILEGRGGADVLEGGVGRDAASYEHAGSGVTADLLAPALGTGDAAGDAFLAIEDLIGSSFADVLRGDAGTNRINGGAGDDELHGRAGADNLDGGIGRDAASYALSSAAVDVDLMRAIQTGGDAAGDKLSSIEDLVGSTYADSLKGNASDNRLAGGAGDDQLAGRGGGDRIDGGAGADLASYSDSKAAIDVDLLRSLQLGGDAAGDTLISIERILGSNYSDKLSGTGASETLTGGLGNDVLNGRGGADTIEGGDGTDTVTYADSSAGVTVNLAQTTGQKGGDAAGDILSGMENLTGSSFNDSLFGNSARNAIVGGLGNDLINGGGDKDTLTGGLGSDTFIFDSAANAMGDRITDFAIGDVLNLSQIDANSKVAGDQAFTLIAARAFSGAAGELRVFKDTAHGITYVQGDVNGDKVADFQIAVDGLHLLGATDFQL